MPKDTALITGASSGLGYHYALQLAEKKTHNLLLVARREEKLKALEQEIRGIWADQNILGLNVECFPTDLSKKEERDALIDEVKGRGFEISLLMNNAGFGSLSKFSDREFDWYEQMIEVNCSAALHLAHAFLPKMLEMKKGQIVNICSIAAFQPMPYMATYAATKSLLLNHSLALQEEIRGSGVKILAVCPGPTETEFAVVAGLKDSVSFLPGMTAAKVAEQTIEAISGGQTLLVNGFLNKLLTILAKVLPKKVAAKIVRFLLKSYA